MKITIICVDSAGNQTRLSSNSLSFTVASDAAVVSDRVRKAVISAYHHIRNGGDYQVLIDDEIIEQAKVECSSNLIAFRVFPDGDTVVSNIPYPAILDSLAEVQSTTTAANKIAVAKAKGLTLTSQEEACLNKRQQMQQQLQSLFSK